MNMKSDYCQPVHSCHETTLKLGTHWSHVLEDLIEPGNDPVDVFLPVYEADPFTVCDLGDDVEGKELQPQLEVANSAGRGV